jgi:polyferredoxin
MATQPAIVTSIPKPGKKLLRRLAPDRSQRIRLLVQLSFVLLNAALGLEFYLWARFYERGGSGLRVPRPAGAEGWLPIAGLMNFRAFLATGRVPAIHPAAMFLFMAFATISLVAKRAFCSWLCPIGTLSELLARFGKKIFGKNLRLPRWLDLPLRSLKYLLLAFFVAIIGFMSAAAIEEFMQTPYGLIADVKMLNFFLEMSGTAAVILAALAALSLLIENFWCRYLCPYGALLGIVSLLSPLKIRRNPAACIDCAKCARACPAALPVDRLVQIRSVECNACLACIAACPADNALQFSLPQRLLPPMAVAPTQAAALPRYRRAVTPAALAALVACIFFGFVLFARATNHWQTNITPQVYQELIPNADLATHPGF